MINVCLKCGSKNELRISNWWPLLHMRRADAASVLTSWQHFSAWNDFMAPFYSSCATFLNVAKEEYMTSV